MNSQLLLAAYLIVFFLAFWVKSFIQRRRTGINPYRFNKSASPVQRFIELYGRIATALWAVLFMSIIAIPDQLHRVEIPFHRAEGLQHEIGMFLAGIFLCGLILAQWNMGSNWRVGIDEENQTDLVTTGLFRYSRNPVFAMIIGVLSSLTLAFPSIITGLLLWMSTAGLYLQILCEEEFLRSKHRERYEAYCRSTDRLLPRVFGRQHLTML